METNSNQLEIKNHGQIDRMVLPPDWIEGKRRDNVVANSTLRRFHPPEDPDCAIRLFYRGRPVNAKAAAAFRAAMQSPPHDLSDEEVRVLSTIFREKSDPGEFDMRRARTEDLNNKRILRIEGRYREIQEDILAILLDADRTGRSVQEIFFQAPPDAYAGHLEEVTKTFESIEWK